MLICIFRYKKYQIIYHFHAFITHISRQCNCRQTERIVISQPVKKSRKARQHVLLSRPAIFASTRSWTSLVRQIKAEIRRLWLSPDILVVSECKIKMRERSITR